ncbi:hypothetical protein BTVI_81203 [Pitangus sulphuratus]|nr:hypothetical protein BTVI_81203 [Pitangus sulphuratus]
MTGSTDEEIIDIMEQKVDQKKAENDINAIKGKKSHLSSQDAQMNAQGWALRKGENVVGMEKGGNDQSTEAASPAIGGWESETKEEIQDSVRVVRKTTLYHYLQELKDISTDYITSGIAREYEDK